MFNAHEYFIVCFKCSALNVYIFKCAVPLSYLRNNDFNNEVCVQVPYTYFEYDAHSNLWPGVQTAFELTNRYQLVNSYGLFRRMTGVGGRPEVVIEGSMDRNTWTVSLLVFEQVRSVRITSFNCMKERLHEEYETYQKKPKRSEILTSNQKSWMNENKI